MFRDPVRIILQGSNDYNSETGQGNFIKLYDSGKDSSLTFPARGEENEFTFGNDEAYKHYAIVFEKNTSTNKIHIGHYGLVQSYTNEVVAEFHKRFTGNNVFDYVTPPPTEVPSAAPSGSGYEFVNNANQALKDAVNMWVSNRSAAEEKYGHISTWNTGKVTSMDGLFENKHDFNDDISGWDTSQVTSFMYLFTSATNFNQPLDKWNTSKVTNLHKTFQRMDKFNQNLSSWDVSRVTKMEFLFSWAYEYNQPLSSWNTSSATNMFKMFYEARRFDQELSSWDVTKVTSMEAMFWGAKEFEQCLPWETTDKDIRYIFDGNSKGSWC